MDFFCGLLLGEILHEKQILKIRFFQVVMSSHDHLPLTLISIYFDQVDHLRKNFTFYNHEISMLTIILFEVFDSEIEFMNEAAKLADFPNT